MTGLEDATSKPEEAGTGIWPPFRIMYVQSMLFCTTSALRSVDRLNLQLKRMMERPEGVAQPAGIEKFVLNELQNIIQQGAALSRYFWPIAKNPVNLQRAAYLRSRLQISDTNSLRDRSLRNAIEHFDERLDTYLQGHIVGHILPEYVGPSLESDGVPNHLFRAYFTDVGVFGLLGDTYEMEPIANEIYRVHELLEQLDA